MDTRIGFLEAGFENALAARELPNSGNIIDLNNHPDGPWRERERRFHQLLDVLPAAIYTTDTAGRLTYYNGGGAALWAERTTRLEQSGCMRLKWSWCG